MVKVQLWVEDDDARVVIMGSALRGMLEIAVADAAAIEGPPRPRLLEVAWNSWGVALTREREKLMDQVERGLRLLHASHTSGGDPTRLALRFGLESDDGHVVVMLEQETLPGTQPHRAVAELLVQRLIGSFGVAGVDHIAGLALHPIAAAWAKLKELRETEAAS